MQLTSDDIRQIIKEELNKLLKESREGGFDPNEEIPDAAPEGFEKTYDSAFTSTGESSHEECNKLLEEIVELCTATELSIDDDQKEGLEAHGVPFYGDNIRVINRKLPLWKWIRDDHYHMFDHEQELQSRISWKLGKKLFHDESAAKKCYWYPIVDSLKAEIYGNVDLEESGPFKYSEEKTLGLYFKKYRREDVIRVNLYYEKFYRFTTSLAKELRKFQSEEYEEFRGTGGDVE